MENRELYKAIEDLARQAKKSGKAKSRRNHLLVAQMLYMVLGIVTIGCEPAMVGVMEEAYARIFSSWSEGK